MERVKVLPPKLKADHVELMSKMDSIKDIKTKWETNKSADNATTILAEIKKSVYELRDLLFDHLSEEEQIVPPLLKANFTFEEDSGTVGRIFQESGPE